ncbi:hypothetical protein TNCV_2318211 [Trichonephila clavipes]|nr:hypothetical protein TNCV_2318211 [Trichonephila clavipes]
MAVKVILEFVQRSKNIIDANSDEQNEMNNTASVPTSSEVKKVMKSMRSYLDTHSNGEMNNKMDDIEQIVDNSLLKRQCKENHMTPTADSDVVQSGRPIFDDFFQHLWPYIGNNTANVVFQMVKRLWLIRIDQ